MGTVLFTGFPGFLGSELLPRVLDRDPDARAACLIQAKYAPLAGQRAADIVARQPALAGRIDLVEGDLTVPGLGLGAGAPRPADVTEIFHLAAAYDLTVSRDLAQRVNVDGTRHVLDHAAACPRLVRLHHVSTCFVSGTAPGLFAEDDLERGQGFHNHYEESKFLAEVAVRDRLREGLPATIYRPAIALGDSRTGATQKYDGLYLVIRWLLRQPRLALLPMIGDPSRSWLNVVPSDFVVDAIAHLSGLESSLGRTYQLADPAPPTVDETIDLLADACRRRIVRVPMPLAAARFAIDRVPGVYRLMGIPAEALDYFALPTRFDTANTRTDLAGSGLRAPHLAEYVDALVAFVRAHPGIGSAAMV